MTLKTFLISIVILLILVAAFSTIESRIEFEYPFGNWAVPGNAGAPHPGEGESGDGKSVDSNTFSFGSPDKTESQGSSADSSSTEYNPITVEVVEPENESNRWRNLEPFMRPLYYVALGLAVILVVLIVIWIVLEKSK